MQLPPLAPTRATANTSNSTTTAQTPSALGAIEGLAAGTVINARVDRVTKLDVSEQLQKLATEIVRLSNTANNSSGASTKTSTNNIQQPQNNPSSTARQQLATSLDKAIASLQNSATVTKAAAAQAAEPRSLFSVEVSVTAKQAPLEQLSARQAQIQVQAQAKLLQALAPQLNADGKLNLVTAEKLAPQQQIQLQVRADGQLQLKPANSALSAQATMPSTIMPSTNTPREQALSAGLRQYLPYNRPLTQALSQIQDVSKLLNDNRLSLQLQLPAALTKLINSLDNQINTSSATLSARSLQTAIAGSGVFLESHLAKLASTNTALPQTDLKATLLGMIKESSTLLAAAGQLAGITPTPDGASNRALGSAASNIQNLQTALASAASQLRSIDSLRTLARQLPSLAATLPLGAGQLSFEQKQLRSLILHNIRSSAAQAIARLSVLQVSELSSRSSRTTDGGPLQSFSLELPLRMQEQLLPISLQFQQHWAREDESEKGRADEERKNDKKRKKYWRVFMEFDLGDGGQVASEIEYKEPKLSTHLWVSDSTLKSRAGERLGELRQQFEQRGIELDNLVLENGPPPQQETKLTQQSLIDIRT